LACFSNPTSPWLHELIRECGAKLHQQGVHVLYRDYRVYRAKGGRTVIRLATLEPDLNAH
jgi:hypothetical protein